MKSAAPSETGIARRNFWLLWLGMFFTMTAGNFLLVALSLRTYSTTGSIQAASLFFVAQFSAPVLFSGLTEHLCRKLPPRRAMIIADGVSFFAVLAIGVTGGSALWAIFALLLLRGFGDTLLKSARAIAIKTAFSAETLARNNALLAAPHFIGNGLGVMLAAALVDRVSFSTLSFVAAGLIAVAIAAYLCLHTPDEAPEVEGRKTRLKGRIAEAFQDNPPLKLAAIQTCTAIVFLQGIHQVMRTAVPMKSYGLDAAEAGVFQLAAVLGIITATILVAQVRWFRKTVRVTPVLLLSCAALVALWLMPSPIFAAAFYFVFMCSFEIGFIRAQNSLILNATPTALATVMVLMHVIGFSGMALLILAAGALTDHLGGLFTCLLVAGLASALCLAAGRLAGMRSDYSQEAKI